MKDLAKILKKGDLVLVWDSGKQIKIPGIISNIRDNQYCIGFIKNGNMAEHHCFDNCEHLTPEMLEELKK